MLFGKRKKKDDPAPVLQKDLPGYWQSIPLGSTVTLTDEGGH